MRFRIPGVEVGPVVHQEAVLSTILSAVCVSNGVFWADGGCLYRPARFVVIVYQSTPGLSMEIRDVVHNQLQGIVTAHKPLMVAAGLFEYVEPRESLGNVQDFVDECWRDKGEAIYHLGGHEALVKWIDHRLYKGETDGSP